MSFSPVLSYAAAAIAVIMAVGVAVRSRRHAAHWALAASWFVASFSAIASAWAIRAPTVEGLAQWQRGVELSSAVSAACWLLFSLLYARGESRTQLRNSRPVWLSCLLLPPTLVLGFAAGYFAEIRFVESTSQWLLRLGWPGVATHVVVLSTCVLALMNLERTFRAAVGTMRWRIKFMLLGAGVVVTARLYTSSQALLFRGVDPMLEVANSAAILVAAPLFLRSFLRSGKLEIQVYPSRAVIQNSLTVLLAGVYLVVLALFAQVASYFGGNVPFAVKALVVLLALVGMTIVLQSDRFRLSVRRFVSRHFQRPMYDYEAVWKKFTEATASQVEAASLSRSVVTLAADMFQTLSVNLWQIDERQEAFSLGASTALSAETARNIAPTLEEAEQVLQFFQTNPTPVDFERLDAPWAVALRRWHPSEFAHGGDRVAVPLVCRGELRGVLTLGDRVSGVPFSLEDLDMLKCIADHAAASLLNVQLSEKLLQSKELEAFQTMATFFVHDLKNAASTLKLMLQNLPLHYNDPEFRADALRGIGKTVAHINHLTSRLSHLRHELKVDLRPVDLNALVNEATTELGSVSGAALHKEFGEIPPVLADRDQLQKVITNLVLNAREASETEGQVRVSTQRDTSWVVLSVADEGCGMTPEFLANSLFRPFQTTKKNGLGIGMFQTKMIVAAHGGKISVRSEPGQGTVFQVFLRSATT